MGGEKEQQKLPPHREGWGCFIDHRQPLLKLGTREKPWVGEDDPVDGTQVKVFPFPIDVHLRPRGQRQIVGCGGGGGEEPYIRRPGHYWLRLIGESWRCELVR